MPPTLDDLLGAALALVRGLRAAGLGEHAHDLLASLTGGCTSLELVQCLRAELLGLPEGLPSELRDSARALTDLSTTWLEDEGY